MKKITLFASMFLFTAFAYCQAYEGSVQYQKKTQAAALIELPYPPAVVNAAMDDYLSKKGKSKTTDVKGFKSFRNTQTAQNDSANADLYFKTERKSRNEKEVTIVSLVVMDATQSQSGDLHYLSMDGAKNYLNELTTAIEAYNLELMIKEQNEAVIKAESMYKSLTNEGEDLDKKRTSIDKKIAENNNDQQQQLKEIEKQKQKLAEWVSQRRS